MADEKLLPVMVRLMEDGRARTVQVGQAFVSEDEVVLSLEPFSLKLTGPAPRAEPQSGYQPSPTPAPRPATRLGDLEWLAQRSRQVLADPKKQRWHADARAQLADIEAELDRLRGREPEPEGAATGTRG